jgi:hypothetical protein
MPSELQWYTPGKRVIYGRGLGHVTLEDVKEWNDTILSLLEEGIPPIHLVADFTGVISMGVSLLHLRSAMSYVKHPALGWTVTFGNSAVLNILGRIVADLSHVHFHGFRTKKAALEFLIKQDASLAALIEAELVSEE